MLEEIGTVNYLAKEDYESLNNRFEDITSTIEDLSLAKKELLENINEIEIMEKVQRKKMNK